MANMFGKWSKPKPAAKKKEVKRTFASSDEKAAKLSKSEQELQNKQKLIERQNIEKQTKKNIAIMRTHSQSLEQHKTKKQLNEIQYYQNLILKGKALKKKSQKQLDFIKKSKNFQYLPNESGKYDAQTGKFVPFRPLYGNYLTVINNRIAQTKALKQFAGKMEMRRMGTLGVKLGMTTLWDRWGDMIPATIVQLDRVQVVQIKNPQPGNTFYQVQMGIGEKSYKRVTKPLMGHYLKSQVPPKRKLMQFKVSKQCLLPVGYMMSVRHYTPGMGVDVVGVTVGHGFSGTIKQYGFRRQPETHGNSLTTRVLGSTGARQDPGRVFKNKKMYGRMGGNVTTQKGLIIFRIDVDKNIMYLKGSVPGKAGTILKITDSTQWKKKEYNMQLVHYPTFVQEPGKVYARMFSMYCGERDPDEIEVHDNAFIVDDGKEEVQELPIKDNDEKVDRDIDADT